MASNIFINSGEFLEIRCRFHARGHHCSLLIAVACCLLLFNDQAGESCWNCTTMATMVVAVHSTDAMVPKTINTMSFQRCAWNLMVALQALGLVCIIL
jgi:hypothetical protein